MSTLDAWGVSLTSLISPATLSGALIYLVIFVLLAVLLNRALRVFVRVSLEGDVHHKIDRTALGFLQQLGGIFIWIFALVLYAHLIPPLRALGTALLTGASIVSVVLGLAAQNTLGNLVAGLALLIYRPFGVGDTLQVTAPTGLETGTVESISLGYTILQTSDKRRVVLSNSTIANQTTINLTERTAPRVLAEIPVSISYQADIDKAKNILLELAKQLISPSVDQKSTQEVVDCRVADLSSSGVELCLRVWCADSDAADTLQSDVLAAAKQRFEGEGIEIPHGYHVTLEGNPVAAKADLPTS